MDQAFTWCFAAPVFAFLAIVFMIFVVTKLSPDVGLTTERAEERVLDCQRCMGKIRFAMPLPPRIRCSCGNIMGKPDGAKATCPKCRETIHVSRQNKPLLVKCPCGNVAEVAL